MSARVWSDDPAAYDAIVIGSGFGGAMAARALVDAGWSVLMLERGDWVTRSKQSWSADAVGPLSPYYSTEAPFRVTDDQGDTSAGAFHCVGGPSVFYGGVALRFRAEDFEYDPEIAGSAGGGWPWSYSEVEPYYSEAEQILGVVRDRSHRALAQRSLFTPARRAGSHLPENRACSPRSGLPALQAPPCHQSLIQPDAKRLHRMRYLRRVRLRDRGEERRSHGDHTTPTRARAPSPAQHCSNPDSS
jgi:choline dehydrogenase-like flavoprotein